MITVHIAISSKKGKSEAVWIVPVAVSRKLSHGRNCMADPLPCHMLSASITDITQCTCILLHFHVLMLPSEEVHNCEILDKERNEPLKAF